LLKTLLIYPRIGQNGPGSYTDPPLGVMYLATYLQKQGLECDVIDATFMKGWDEFENGLREYRPGIVGLSFASPIAHDGFKAAEIVKRLWPGVFLIAGGPHPTIVPSQTIENEFIDAIVIGEGEIALAKLVLAVGGKSDPGAVPGVWYKKNGQVIRNEAREFVSNLDDLPFPNRKLVNMERYVSANRAIPIHVVRGCPFRCLFCQPTQQRLFGTKVRYRSPDNVVAEMLALKKEFPEKNYVFSFQADTFTMSKKWVLELCQKIISSNLHRTPWICDTRVNAIDREILDAMKMAGCFSICFGVESGSQRILDFLNKGIKVEESRNGLKLCYARNIIPKAYIMMGTPTETGSDLEMTCQLIRDAHPAYLNISRTTPVPGSRIYDYVRERGMLNINRFADYDYYHNEYPIKLEHLTRDDLAVYYRRLMNIWLRSLLAHPSFIIQFFRLLCRFPGYRGHLVKYVFRGLQAGTTGRFFDILLHPSKRGSHA
jgi:radical SAM superfamily enzyme YgiQ (UPF0313 family)